MAEKFDVIIVGAGVSGLSAAYLLAQGGKRVAILERGQHPGAKNVMGGVLYRKMMEEIIPEFWKDAPLERPLIEQNFWLLDSHSAAKVGYRDADWSAPPHNNYTVFRGKFDQWFAEKCVEAGALLLCKVNAVRCIRKNGRVVGVETDRPDGQLYADVVVLADGVNSLLAKDLGFHREWRSSEVALVAMEMLKLPSNVIEERFYLDPGMGATIEMFGDSTAGMVGTAYLYTHREHLSIGCGALLSQMAERGTAPYDLLEHVKQHPMVAPLVKEAEPCEYYAHLIPEGGFDSIPQLVGNGVLVVGDAAQLVNGIHREGSNLAMASGRLAAETILEASHAGRFDRAALAPYEARVRDSFIGKDLKKYRRASRTLEEHPDYFGHYLPAANRAMHEMFLVDGVSKSEKQKKILKDLTKGRSLFGAARDGIKLLWAVK